MDPVRKILGIRKDRRSKNYQKCPKCGDVLGPRGECFTCQVRKTAKKNKGLKSLVGKRITKKNLRYEIYPDNPQYGTIIADDGLNTVIDWVYNGKIIRGITPRHGLIIDGKLMQ